ncbi:MAG TPA: gluconate 2-dehydrogenase subunit 3 family protein [Bryobacteraceae bacterium]
MPDEKPAGDLTRRTVIVTAAAAAFVPLSAIRSAAQTPAPQRVFSAEQKRTLEAFLDRLCPKDELGPGAVEIGAQDYIEVQLGDYLAPEKQTFLDGLAAVDAYARQSHGSPLADLSPEKRDQVLTDIDSGKAPQNARGFFNRARRLMLEGMFGDPHYGGNKNFAGWDLIGYPGPRLATGPEMQKMGAPIAPYHRSAWGNEHGGH